MGALANPTRLVWESHTGRGVACHDGVTVELKVPPAVGIDHLVHLEYSPTVRVFECRVSADARRDLTAEESAQCAAFLSRVAEAAHAAITGASNAAT